jgi:drug/metabolite transporter (DMT)-like permease
VRLTHGGAAASMVLVTLMWSIAGVIVRHLDSAASFEVTFWRSAFNALALGAALTVMRGAKLWSGLLRAPRILWVSGLCWSVMFTAFMVAVTLTTVANVLITMALGPLITALFSRVFLHHRLAPRTWAAIVVAGAGIAWMFGQNASTNGAQSLLGVLVALAVPVAASINWTLLQHVGHGQQDEAQDMLPAVLIGAVISALVTLPLAVPFKATSGDLGLLALLGVVQLAIPCLLVVRISRVLPAPELSLLGLLEVIFGVLWAWWFAGEAPGSTALTGGALVIGALVANELLAMRSPAVSKEPR